MKNQKKSNEKKFQNKTENDYTFSCIKFMTIPSFWFCPAPDSKQWKTNRKKKLPKKNSLIKNFEKPAAFTTNFILQIQFFFTLLVFTQRNNGKNWNGWNSYIKLNENFLQQNQAIMYINFLPWVNPISSSHNSRFSCLRLLDPILRWYGV